MKGPPVAGEEMWSVSPSLSSQVRSTTSPTDANDVPPTLFPLGRAAHTLTHSHPPGALAFYFYGYV